MTFTTTQSSSSQIHWYNKSFDKKKNHEKSNVPHTISDVLCNSKKGLINGMTSATTQSYSSQIH
jgi:hypothetical protein